jgi:hypothetical protein
VSVPSPFPRRPLSGSVQEQLDVLWQDNITLHNQINFIVEAMELATKAEEHRRAAAGAASRPYRRGRHLSLVREASQGAGQ